MLFDLAEDINLNSSVMRMGLNHDVAILPVGKIIRVKHVCSI